MKRFMVRVNGIDIFCRDTGGEKPVMLCFHGKWGRGETWAELIGRYQDRYRIIAPDQRGHGLSGKPVARYAPEDFAEDAHQLIGALGCGPVIVVGHSMGGRTAGFLSAMYADDVRACVILDIGADGPPTLSTLSPDQVGTKDEYTDNWHTPYATYEDAVREMKSLFSYESNVRYFLESLTETVEGYDFMFSRQAMAATLEYKHQWFDLLPRISCPVLLVRATESTDFFPEVAERMRGLIRDCTYFEVSKSDHMVYADNPEGFYPQFEKFLEKLKA